MKSNKDRDLAKELVDFLLKEEQKKRKATPEPQPPNDQKTATEVLPETKDKATYVEFDLDLGNGDVPEINFNNPSTKIPEIKVKSEVKPEAKKVPEIVKEPIRKNAVAPEKRVDVSVNQGAVGSPRTQMIYNEVAHLMGGVEAIRVAQSRITALEAERDKLRDETEKLLATADSYQRQVAELRAQKENLDRRHRERVEILEEEKVVLKSRMDAREKELVDVRKRNEELQARFQNDLHKVRVRERDLESRYELLKAEMTAVGHSKDEMILELRRQLEQLHFELDNFRAKSADMHSKINEFFDRNHRTVKALRLALNVLEAGDGDDPKKASGE